LSTFLPYLINWLQAYGYPVLWLSVFIASIGAPLPTVLILLAAGSFAAIGDFNIFLLMVVAISASVCGDTVGYLIGRRIGKPIFSWLARPHKIRLISSRTLEYAHDYFTRRGFWAVFLTRFIFVALNGIVNILAGAERYSYTRFLLADVCGEILNALIPLLLGYTFSESWEAVGDIVGGISALLLALAVIIFLVIQLMGMLQRARATEQAKQQAEGHNTAPVRAAKLLPPPTPG
jgi:membrane-associated protein